MLEFTLAWKEEKNKTVGSEFTFAGGEKRPAASELLGAVSRRGRGQRWEAAALVINLIAVKLQWRFEAKEAGKPGANTAGDTMLLLRKGPPGGRAGVGSFSEEVIRVFTLSLAFKSLKNAISRNGRSIRVRNTSKQQCKKPEAG